MRTTRRSFLVQGGVIGAGLIAGHLPAARVFAQSLPPRRRSLQGLAWNDPIIQAYRDAVGIFKNKPASDRFNWVKLADFHGSYNGGYKYCPHGDWYFLPWHRAFTAMYERLVRQAVSDNSFAMPFWDWTANPLMPEVFLPKTTPDGKTNWLCVNEDGMSRTWPANKPMPDSIVGPKVLQKILSDTPYEVFGTGKNPQQNNLDPRWVPRGGGTQGTLEATPHNNVHNNIGGWMPSPASPRDPMFFAHHANIDRIWAVWNLKHSNTTNSLWTDMPFQNNFLNPDGTFWSPKVSDLYVPEKLGYTYGLSSNLTARAPALLSLDSKLTALVEAPALTGVGAETAVTFRVENQKTATADAPLSLTLPFPQEAFGRVLKRSPAGSGVEMLSFDAAEEANAAAPRVLAFIRDVGITDAKTTAFRIYLGDPSPNASSPDADPHYVGTFAELDHSGGHGDHEKDPPSFAVDLTDAIQRVYGSGLTAPGKVELKLLPVSNDAVAGGPVGTATPKSVEVALVSG